MNNADTVEEQLNSLIANKQTGRFAAIQTHGGIRKFLFYVTSEAVARGAQKGLKVPAPYKVELTTAKDPGWSVYAKIKSEQLTKR